MVGNWRAFKTEGIVLEGVTNWDLCNIYQARTSAQQLMTAERKIARKHTVKIQGNMIQAKQYKEKTSMTINCTAGCRYRYSTENCYSRQRCLAIVRQTEQS